MTKYIVATSNGGLMECPEVYYDKFQLIEADSEDLARKMYNDKNNCKYFYGVVICEYTEDNAWILDERIISENLMKHLKRVLI